MKAMHLFFEDDRRVAEVLIELLKVVSVGSFRALFSPHTKFFKAMIKGRKQRLELVKDPFIISEIVIDLCQASACVLAVSKFLDAKRDYYQGDLQYKNALASTSLLYMQHCKAISLLSQEGLDIQAKVVLRSAFEASDLLIVMKEDSELRREFVEVGDGDAAREFWRRHLYRGRLFSRSNEVFSQKFNRSELGFDYGAWKNAEIDFLSQCVHPSHFAGFMSMMGNMYSAAMATGNVSPLTLGDGDRHIGVYRTAKSLGLQTIRLMLVYADDFIVDFVKRRTPPRSFRDIAAILCIICPWMDQKCNGMAELIDEETEWQA